MLNGWVGYCVAGLGLAMVGGLAYWLTGRVLDYARQRLLDLPNARSSHVAPTPRGGGLAIVLAYTLGLTVLWLMGGIGFGLVMALLGGLPVAAIGFLDDHRPVPARWRMLVHVLSASWALAWLGGLPALALNGQILQLGVLGGALALLLIVWMLNLFNFMDGIDGLAAGETVFVALAGALLLIFFRGMEEQAWAAALLGFACAGFLVWNWPPAKIFMGDVGSGFLGFILGVLAVASIAEGGLSFAVWLILSGAFFVDASFTLLRRMAGGQRWYEAHRSHAYQQAALRLGSHRPVTLGFLAINGFWLLPLAAFAVAGPRLELWFLLLAYAPLLFWVIRFDAGKTA